MIQFSEINTKKEPKTRAERISQMTALYEKNFAKYESAKGTLGNLLKEGGLTKWLYNNIFQFKLMLERWCTFEDNI